MKPRHLFPCLSALLLPFLATAQAADNRTETIDALTPPSPLLNSAMQEDLGDIQESNPYKPAFDLDAQTRFDYVSNALLHSNGGSSDFLFLPSVTAHFVQPLPRGFSLDLSARVESVNYSRHSSLDFWGPSGSAYIDWQYKSSWPTVYFGTEPYFYEGYKADNKAAAVDITTGIVQTFALTSDGRNQLMLDYKYADYFAHPCLDNRMINRVGVTLTHHFSQQLYVQLYYACQFGYYGNSQPFISFPPPLHRFTITNIHREDSRNSAGVNLVRKFNANLTGNITCAWIDNESNLGTSSYKNLIVSLGFNWRFF